MFDSKDEVCIRDEYEKAFLLNRFTKICYKMNNDSSFKQLLLTLYRQSIDVIETTKLIWQKEYDSKITSHSAQLLYSWIWAYFKKKPYRQPISLNVKQNLYTKQNGICNICHNELGNNWEGIHVDHCVPWTLVGDELEDNLQLLCSTCNKKKSNQTDYIFKNMIGLN